MVAGVGSTFPTPSMARTWNIWLPRPRLVYDLGLAQDEKAAPSSEHSKVSDAAGVRLSVPLKVKLAEVLLVALAGPLRIVVSGGVASTV